MKALSISADNYRTRKALRALGLSPSRCLQLERFAMDEDLTLRDYVLFVLNDYAPPQEPEE